MDKVIFSKFSNERSENLKIRTDIFENENGERYVQKVPCSKESEEHINKLFEHYEILKRLFQDTNLEPNVCSKTKDGVRFEYLHGDDLETILGTLIKNGDMDEAKRKLSSFINQLKDVYKDDFQMTYEFEKVFGKVELPSGLKGSKYINIDLITSNIIVKDDIMNIIDYEWIMEFSVPVNYLIYRILFYFPWLDMMQQMYDKNIYEIFGLSQQELDVYKSMENQFQLYTKRNYYSVTDWSFSRVYKNLLDVDAFKYLNIRFCFDLGNGYTKENTEVVRVVLDETGTFDINVPVPQNTVGICVNPSEYSCLLYVSHFDMKFGEKEKKVAFDGQVKKLGDVYTLIDDDTQLRITNLEQDVEFIHFSGHISLKVNKRIIHNINEYSWKIENDNGILAMNNNVLKNNVRERELTIQYLSRELEISRKELASVYASRSWRLTSGLRKFVGFIRKHRALYLIAKGLKVTIKQGPIVACKKIYNHMKWKNVDVVRYAPPEIGRYNDKLKENEEHFDEILGTEKLDKKIAVHVHLYYEDLLGEFLGYLDNIPYTFDVFISCQENADVKRIKKGLKKLSHVNKITVMPMMNRGRDIAPLYVGFAKEIERYDYFLHVHSKKSLYTGNERVGWRNYSLSSILGSESVVRKIFELFERNEDVGLVYPDYHEEVPALAYAWLANEGLGRHFLELINVPFKEGLFMYPVGSFFWARTDALRTLFDMNLTFEDFPEEAGQTDGTLAHVIERCTSLICKNNGYQDAIIDYSEGLVRYDMSFKPFRLYSKFEIEHLVEYLMQFEVISFDIFDTLITRTIYSPDDLFRIMSYLIEKKYDIQIDFLSLRKNAEFNANKIYGVSTNIYNIYDELKKLIPLEEEQVIELQELEIELELKYCIPREDMLNVFNQLVENGKRVILTSDMYLNADIIETILLNNGYTGYEKIYVSCECGCRKDDGSFWEYLLNIYSDEQFIHVGDNPRSDWQTLEDRHLKSFWVISPKDELKISDLNPISKFEEKDLNNSLALGTIINAGIFNSPFMLTSEGSVRFKSMKNFGFSIFGPLFYNFICYINQKSAKDDILLFLAREGYILKQVYDIVFDENNPNRRENHYFLASRRAVTVAGISEWEDVRDIIKMDYSGDLSNLLWSRLGIKLKDSVKDEEIHICPSETEDVDKVMAILEKDKDTILEQFAKEKRTYIKYIDSLVERKDWDKLVCVDVGYSGTIQYYLAKMLNKQIAGIYLATFEQKKPELLGCKCNGMYCIQDDFGRVLHSTQLFLEAALTAPYGQLVRFIDENGKIVPEYKKENIISESIKELQEGILSYCKMRVDNNLLEEKQVPMDVPLMEKIYSSYLNGSNMTEELANCFFVEDDYCSNGFLKYDKNDNRWKV